MAAESGAVIVYADAGGCARPVVVGLGIHLPEKIALSAASVDFVDRSPSVGHIHHSVLDDWLTLQSAMRPDSAAFDPTKVHRPGNLEVFDIVFVYFLQTRIPGGGIIFLVMQPIHF